MSGIRGNSSNQGSKARREAYQDAIGLSPDAFDVLVAVCAFERCYGLSAPTAEVRRFLGTHDLQLNELTRGLWLTVDGKLGERRLSARTRAWQTLGFSRDERRTA